MIYIAGPISHLKNYREVFKFVKEDAERRFGGEWMIPSFDTPARGYTDYMARDLWTLAQCDAMLRIGYCHLSGNWARSEGRAFECYCARQDKKPIFDVYVCELPDGTHTIIYDDDVEIKMFLEKSK